MPTFYSCGLVVEVTVDSKDNEAEKTREVADIYISHISLQLEFSSTKCDELRSCCMASKFFIFLTCLTTLDIWAMVVNDTVDAKHNMEKKTTRYDRNAPF